MNHHMTFPSRPPKSLAERTLDFLSRPAVGTLVVLLAMYWLTDQRGMSFAEMRIASETIAEQVAAKFEGTLARLSEQGASIREDTAALEKNYAKLSSEVDSLSKERLTLATTQANAEQRIAALGAKNIEDLVAFEKITDDRLAIVKKDVDDRVAAIEKKVDERFVEIGNMMGELKGAMSRIEKQNSEQGAKLTSYINAGGAPGIDWATSSLSGEIGNSTQGVNRDWKGWTHAIFHNGLRALALSELFPDSKEQNRNKVLISPPPQLLISDELLIPNKCFIAFAPVNIEINLVFPDIAISHVGITHVRRHPRNNFDPKNFQVARKLSSGKWEKPHAFQYDTDNTQLQVFSLPLEVGTSVRFTFLDNRTGFLFEGKSPVCLFRLHVYGERTPGTKA
eukprot:GEMP01027754.1.p1 GENE.GEMP01027754.1~~GEMP01027754.1.p1  ORF type:complete len:407 (+),score=81.95 GEMP01027754.1:40-1221(+)